VSQTTTMDDPVTVPRSTLVRAKALLLRVAKEEVVPAGDAREVLELMVSGIARSDLARELSPPAPEPEKQPRPAPPLHVVTRAAGGASAG
jgi:hypothetical protein